jgi:hypothetical protein
MQATCLGQKRLPKAAVTNSLALSRADHSQLNYSTVMDGKKEDGIISEEIIRRGFFRVL